MNFTYVPYSPNLYVPILQGSSDARVPYTASGLCRPAQGDYFSACWILQLVILTFSYIDWKKNLMVWFKQTA